MKEYKVIGDSVEFNPGAKLGLDKKQFDKRIHLVKPVNEEKDNNIYVVTAKTHFKSGETFLYDGELPKTQARLAKDIEELEQESEVDAVAAKIKRMTTDELVDFYFMQCEGQEFSEDEKLTNPKRQELILEWVKENPGKVGTV